MLEAEEYLTAHGGKLEAYELERLTLIATGDEKFAEKVRVRRQLDELRAGNDIQV